MPWLDAWLHEAQRLRPAHAVLLHGASGIGQWELATCLAQAWLCESGAAHLPCGHCAACRLVQAHSHPDLLVLLPENLQEPLGWADPEPAAETGAKTRQPSKEIRVDAIRRAVSFAQTTAARGRTKVVVIHPAERMNAVAANALLKTLEEPPGGARFVLACAAPHLLLPTIRSRCQALALGLPDAGRAAAWLADNGVVDAVVMLAAAGGQPLDALAWHRLGVDAQAWARLPAALAAADASALAAWPISGAIEALQKVCHDAMAVSVGAEPRYFPTSALPRGPRLAALLAWAADLARAARQAEHPLQAALTLDALCAQAQRALAPRPAARGDSLHSAR